MSYIWVLLLIAAPILIWKLTSPSFLVELVFTALKPLFAVKPHSKEYWDTVHALETASTSEERRDLQWKLKELQSKEAKTNT